MSRNCDCQHHGSRELGGSGTVNSGEVLCKGRDVRQAKGAACRAALPCPPHWGGRIRLEPKGMWPGAEAQRSSAAAEVPPADARAGYRFSQLTAADRREANTVLEIDPAA